MQQNKAGPTLQALVGRTVSSHCVNRCDLWLTMLRWWTSPITLAKLSFHWSGPFHVHRSGLAIPYNTALLLQLWPCKVALCQHSVLVFLNYGACSLCRTGWKRLEWSACIILQLSIYPEYLSGISGLCSLFFSIKVYWQGISAMTRWRRLIVFGAPSFLPHWRSIIFCLSSCFPELLEEEGRRPTKSVTGVR